jgi:hypothetical protein
VPEEERARMAAAASLLRRTYPPAEDVLPTSLGNVLRAAEDRAGRRYGLVTRVVWPRLFALLPEGLRRTLDDQRDQLDLTARFCVVFLAIGAVYSVLLVSHGWWLLAALGAVLLAWVSYRAAVSAAMAYGQAIEAAFDLHRFDLLKALHLPLPPNREVERKANEELSQFLLQGRPVDFDYEHKGGT